MKNKDAEALGGGGCEDELLDYAEAVEGIRDGYTDLPAGRVETAESVFEDLRIRHGLPR